MNKFIAISIGDIRGVGIEILLNLWIKKKIRNIIIFSNTRYIKKYLKLNNINQSIISINEKNLYENSLNKNKLLIFNYNAKNEIENSYKSLSISYRITLKYQLKGLITLPINKEKIIKNFDPKFIGQTEFFQKIDKKKISNMIFYHKKIIITNLTTHIKIKDINKYLSKKNYIFNKIILLNKVLINDFNIKNPKMIISGLNPHAGENVLIGNEEIKYIKPVLIKLKKRNINIDGIVSGDALLTKNNIKKYSCFIFIFHDQALIPFKYISQNSGVNFTSGLKIIRVSPDHGTAYKIVGKNIANNKSLLNCFSFINKIYSNRNKAYNHLNNKK